MKNPVKHIFLPLVLLITTTAYASQSYYEEDYIPTTYSLSPIVIQDEIHIPTDNTITYANHHDPKKQIYPNSILKCKKLSGEGTIHIAEGNQLIIQADNIADFTGHIRCEQFAICIMYTKNANNIAFTLYGNPILLVESKS